jgi:hypothetical protein
MSGCAPSASLIFAGTNAHLLSPCQIRLAIEPVSETDNIFHGDSNHRLILDEGIAWNLTVRLDKRV